MNDDFYNLENQTTVWLARFPEGFRAARDPESTNFHDGRPVDFEDAQRSLIFGGEMLHRSLESAYLEACAALDRGAVANRGIRPVKFDRPLVEMSRAAAKRRIAQYWLNYKVSGA